VGWTHAITRQARFSITGGPQVTNGSPAAEVSASVQYRMKPLDLALTYARRQTTLIGLTGTADVQSVTASTGLRFPRQLLTVQMSPAFYQTTGEMIRQSAYRLAIDIVRPIVSSLSLDVTVEGHVQPDSRFAPSGYGRLARQAVTIALVAAPAVRH
jgi:hypothetical protein